MRFLDDNLRADRSSLGPRMRVIGAGLPRCATSSLQAALEAPHLDFKPCMHMAHVLPHPRRSQMVLEAMRETNTSRRQTLLHKLFDGYEATTDFPGFWFIVDLMDMYPDAAIVLNQRKSGGEGWIKSFQNSLGLFMSLKYYIICFLHKSDRLHYDIHSVAKMQCIPRYGVMPGPEFYYMYQDLVLREAEKRGRKVLIWTVEDGWDPLCRFLEKPIPKNEPFPWVNDAATMRKLKIILLGRGILSWVALFGLLYAAWIYGGFCGGC